MGRELPEDPVEAVLAYHQRTKHRPERFARSLGYMDWENQPVPYRRYVGAKLLDLEEVPAGDPIALDGIYLPADNPVRPMGQASLAQLFYDSLALSAWKQAGGGRWSLRVNPSSGNLHPTEGFLICRSWAPLRPDGPRRAGGLYHYSPLDHGLEHRLEVPDDRLQGLFDGLPTESVLVGLSSIPWREAWKYGERAFRYCQLDVGHAIAALAFAASLLGWSCRLLPAVAEDDLADLLALDPRAGPEAEHPDCLLALFPHDVHPDPGLLRNWSPPGDLLAWWRDQTCSGQPNPLSENHHPWPVIDQVSAAARLGAGTLPPSWTPPPSVAVAASTRPARAILRSRRSAADMDGQTPMPAAGFARLLARLLPCADGPPFGSLAWRPAIHPIFFVHRVADLEPGLYLQVRDANQRDCLAQSLDADFEWSEPDSPFADLGLVCLRTADVGATAEDLACRQAIASRGAFAVAMLADLDARVRSLGACEYRRIFWEAGVLGQVLYLEAEVAGLRGTGIGCFFDDDVHALLGLADGAFQSVYHFTVGGPVDDPRVQDLPAYFHRRT